MRNVGFFLSGLILVLAGAVGAFVPYISTWVWISFLIFGYLTLADVKRRNYVFLIAAMSISGCSYTQAKVTVYAENRAIPDTYIGARAEVFSYEKR